MPTGSQLVNAIPEIVRFRPAQPVTHFSKPFHAYNALVLYFCRLCVEPLEERDRTVSLLRTGPLLFSASPISFYRIIAIFRVSFNRIIAIINKRPSIH